MNQATILDAIPEMYRRIVPDSFGRAVPEERYATCDGLLYWRALKTYQTTLEWVLTLHGCSSSGGRPIRS